MAKLIIDYCTINAHSKNSFFQNNITDEFNSNKSFAAVDYSGIYRFNYRWDDKFIYAKLNDFRPFTFLEQMLEKLNSWNPYFVKDGKLYVYNRQKLLVFDVRSKRIRKLGHFEKMTDNFSIYDIKVLEDGNIVIITQVNKTKMLNGKRVQYRKLFLLEDPE